MKYLLFLFLASCTLQVDEFRSDARYQCLRLDDALETRESECGMTLPHHKCLNVTGYVGDMDACIDAVRNAACDVIEDTYNTYCAGLFFELGQ